MSLALEMVVVAPAGGNAPLSGAQRGLLAGKSRWIRAIWESGLSTVPTILITRAAWDGLQNERLHSAERLRPHWVATLFRLVGSDGRPPSLVVRTATDRSVSRLAPARLGIPAPSTEAEAVDPRRPLGRSIADAFASYGGEDPRDIVLVQAVADDEGLLASDVEMDVDGPSYTFATLDRLAAQGVRGDSLFLILGGDAFKDLPTWKAYPALLDRCHFVVVSRPGVRAGEVRALVPALADRMRDAPCEMPLAPSIFLVDAPTAPVSSTGVRQAVLDGQDLGALVPAAVAALPSGMISIRAVETPSTTAPRIVTMNTGAEAMSPTATIARTLNSRIAAAEMMTCCPPRSNRPVCSWSAMSRPPTAP